MPNFTFVDVDLSQPGSKPHLPQKPSEGKAEHEKYSFLIMEELYPYYVKCRNEPHLTKLLWLDPVLGSFQPKGRNVRMFGDGVTFDKSHCETNYWEVPNSKFKSDGAAAFVRDHNKFTFEDFVNEVKQGTFSCDEIEPFVAHVEKHAKGELEISKFYQMAKAKLQPQVEEKEDADGEEGEECDGDEGEGGGGGGGPT